MVIPHAPEIVGDEKEGNTVFISEMCGMDVSHRTRAIRKMGDPQKSVRYFPQLLTQTPA